MFSIIIPLYNKQNYIAKTINSVLSQDFFSVEIIVVDDGSIDGSKSVVETIKDNRIHLYTKPNGGPSSAAILPIFLEFRLRWKGLDSNRQQSS